MTEEELIQEIESQRDLMISVSTGGSRIQEVNDEYKTRGQRIREGLEALGIKDPNPYSELWRWYSKWSSGDLPTYQSRRLYISDLYDPLVCRLLQVFLQNPCGLTEQYSILVCLIRHIAECIWLRVLGPRFESCQAGPHVRSNRWAEHVGY